MFDRVAIWPAIQSDGSRPSSTMCWKMRAQSRVWLSSASLRKSGTWHASHSSSTRGREVAMPRIAGSRARCARVTWSTASWPLVRPGCGVGARRLSSSASTEAKSRSLLRQHSAPSASNWCASMLSTMWSGSAGHSPVVPKVPSRMPRPARPAICAASCAVRARLFWPSNLLRLAKATWSTSMLRPMPTASVATRKSTSRSWYIFTWALRVRGLRRPMTTAQPPRRLRIASAMAYTSPAENATTAERGGSLVSFAGPACESCERRGRTSTSTCGTRRVSSGRMVSAPMNIVSTRPRACSSRSVKMCPRSGSAQSWISSTARNSTLRSSGMASTVQANHLASGGTIFSSPVMSATCASPFWATMRS